MLRSLTAVNFTGTETFPSHPHVFTLKTCQRTLLVSFDLPASLLEHPDSQVYRGESAYQFVLEVICGLQSQMLAENEIVHQFRLAFKEFLLFSHKDKRLIRVFEKILKDAKEIRSQYLKEIGQKTYAALVRKIVFTSATQGPVLILGSGNLAVDLINQFKKKSDVYLSSRNHKAKLELCKQHTLKAVPWKKDHHYLNFSRIINTIGCEEKLWDDQFFSPWNQKWREKIFVDLGSPSSIQTSLQGPVVNLEQIFERGAFKEKEKMEKVHLAKGKIIDLARKRIDHFKQSHEQHSLSL